MVSFTQIVNVMQRKHKATHTSCRKGKRVSIHLSSTDKIVIGKFVEVTAKHVILENDVKIAKADIRSFIIYKGK